MNETPKAPEYHLGFYQSLVDHALAELKDTRIISRIWAHDHTVWKPDPTEITNRLGWLHSPEVMAEEVERITDFVKRVRMDGYTQALLLGMGGSSLAPEVFRKTFGVREGHLDLAVLDSTDPGAVLDYAGRLAPERSLFIVSTKSGTTVETLSFFKFFYNWVKDWLGENRAGEHFIAITDPGSPLVELASRYRFRECFLNDPNIGGRYSVLSLFGLVPAALLGVDITRLLGSAMAMKGTCAANNDRVEGNNPGAILGLALGELAKSGRDKVTLICSPRTDEFGNWAEQLIAESTGKEGRGILPVVEESIGPPAVYGEDRLFVYMHLAGEKVHEETMAQIVRAGHPVVRLPLNGLYDLGGQFFLWEMAVAVAGHRLGINPFDQPNVEQSKALARQVAEEYKEKGSLPSEPPALSSEGVAVYGEVTADTPAHALKGFFDQAPSGEYIAIQAFVQPTSEVHDVLQRLRTALRERYRLATTLGFGPRYLHSTGQLHKGDAGKGLFLQFTADSPRDAEIPDEPGSNESSMSFGVLKAAQAIGDRRALLDRSRKVIRFHFEGDLIQGLKKLWKGSSAPHAGQTTVMWKGDGDDSD
ncbi:MAG: glucose-6-phosphate isomerase [Thermodesulfobacteriota bacterium]